MPSLHLSLHKTKFLVAEPIIATVRLGSETSETYPEFYDSSSFKRQADFVFLLASVEGERLGKEVFNGRGGGTQRRPPLKAGEFWQCEKMFVPMRGDSRERCQRPLRPGKYTMRAKVAWRPPVEIDGKLQHAPGRWLVSNAAQFTVAQPNGTDAEACRILLSKDFDGFFEGATGGTVSAIDELLRKYLESTYARYASARILLDRVAWFRNFRRTGVSEADREEAERLVAEALQLAARPEFRPLADNLLLARARLQTILYDRRGAARTLRLIVEEFPDSDAAEQAAKRLERMPDAFRELPQLSLPDPERGWTGRLSALWRRWHVPAVAIGCVLILGLILWLRHRKRSK